MKRAVFFLAIAAIAATLSGCGALIMYQAGKAQEQDSNQINE